MDTLIKMNIKTSYSSNYQGKSKQIEFKLADFNKLYLENSMFEFKEYDRTEVEFHSTDNDVLFKVESHYNPISSEHVDESIVTLKPGESIILSPGGDSADMLVPGKYLIQIYKQNYCFEGCFCVIPNSIDWEAMLNIRYYLESTVKGLAYNIYLEKKATKSNENNLDQNIEAYRYLYSNQDSLFNHLKCIEQNPISDLKKEYKIREYSKKKTNKSQRWQAKKGDKYNKSITVPTAFYEKKCYSTNSTVENIILKRMVSYFQNILIEAEEEYFKILNSINKTIEELQNKSNQKSNAYIEASKLPNTFNVNKLRYAEMGVLDREIASNKEKKEITEKNLTNLYKLKGKLNHYINETWIKDIDVKYNTSTVTTRVLKNYHYNEIYNIYNKLRNTTITNGFDLVFPYKKTSTLFEIYSFLIIKDIFEELGFTWTGGWLKSNTDDNLYNGDLTSGDSIILEKDDYTVIIVYDIYIGIPDELKNVKLSQPSTKPDNQHRRPDILVSLYKGNKLLGCEVIEVKYRRKSNIYNMRGIDTDVCKQLSSYTGFDYYDADKGRVIREKPVYKVLTLYPKQDDLGQYTHGIYDIEFIPIMPSLDSSSKYYGYENLKSEIIEYVEYFVNR
ncbi:hypothetical protein [Romboutsia hominis]|uniref:hypothetical protein n=1 Tax=Romboutsia hominis TaxID=1507512 RepID=UPI001F052A0B|nr:hypothetical protein [Romboutsia hominis]MCH1959853.1 hypothetical protein [Romboutsia hominis]MCH1969724.1 hypothetical protein [Romboutsia hominis]